MEKQVISKKRVADHGEVLTGKREVNAMLDLVKQETEKIDATFLEPACGNGNFLAELLERKLKIVEERYKKSQLEYERNAVLAVSSLYGIDIQEDNVEECRKRLFGIFDWNYSRLFKKTAQNECRTAVQYILTRNIIWGDACTLKTVDDNPQPIVFSQWKLVSGSKLKRRDYAFHDLTYHKDIHKTIFAAQKGVVDRDDGGKGFIPVSLKSYPLTHFLKVADVEEP